MPTSYTNPLLRKFEQIVETLKNQKITLNVFDFFGQPISFNTHINSTPNLFLGQSPGYFFEEATYRYIAKYASNIGIKITHKNQESTYDYYVEVLNQNNNDNINIIDQKNNYNNNFYFRFNIDCKSAIKDTNAKVTKSQLGNTQLNNGQYKSDNGDIIQQDSVETNQSPKQDPVFILYVRYFLSVGGKGKMFLNVEDAYFMPLEYSITPNHRVTTSVFKKQIQNNKGKSIYEKLTLKQSLSYLDLFYKQNINESKKHVMLKKFIENNFNKKGDYLYPKSGDSKCNFHENYSKGLLKFFAEHGITEIYSIYDTHVPSLGFSPDEKKWYGWSHRAIFGFGIGDSMKKNTCGFEIYKKTAKAKTLDDAKEMAKAFAKSVG